MLSLSVAEDEVEPLAGEPFGVLVLCLRGDLIFGWTFCEAKQTKLATTSIDENISQMATYG